MCTEMGQGDLADVKVEEHKMPKIRKLRSRVLRGLAIERRECNKKMIRGRNFFLSSIGDKRGEITTNTTVVVREERRWLDEEDEMRERGIFVLFPKKGQTIVGKF